MLLYNELTNKVELYRGENMREDIFENLRHEIYHRCQKPTNQFGMGCYYHIIAVVKNGEILAEQYGADKEIVMIAAWLHDIASITDYSLYELHHIHGAEMAHRILKEYGYDDKRISLVQKCIRNHRGSISSEKITLEELCVADADAISHFDSVPSLLYLAYVQKGTKFIKIIVMINIKIFFTNLGYFIYSIFSFLY